MRWALLLVFLGLLPGACEEPTEMPKPVDGEPVIIARVVDGDTAELDDGRRVRYIGINTPEQGQPFYEEAKEANRRLAEGKEAWLAIDTQPTDKYGRILAYVWVDDQFVNLELVRQGYANAYTAPPNVRYSEALLAAEQEAREAEIGLWALADLPVQIQKIYYDAPGPDAENPNGEWVEIVNDGSEGVDLSGFTLKDEANHIYTFSNVTLLPGRTLKVYSGQGTDSDDILYWGFSNDAVWNNDGDTAYLRDAEGRLVDRYGY
jgi:micrococcal nuclease